MTKASTSSAKATKAAFKTKKTKISIDVTSDPDSINIFTSSIPLAPPGYRVASITVTGTLSATYQAIVAPALDKEIKTICIELARILKVPSDISIIPVKMEAGDMEARVCDGTGNEVFAVRKWRKKTYDVAFFPRDQKCRHAEPAEPSFLTKAQRKAAPASIWSCVKPAQIEGVWLKDNEVVCSLFRTCHRTDDCERETVYFGGWRDDDDDHDEDDRKHPHLFKSVEDLISQRKPLYCVKNDCMALFCEEH